MSYDDFWAIITALEGVIECLLLSVRNRSETDRQRLCYVREVLDHSADNRCGTQLSSLECLNMNRFEIFDRSTNDQYNTVFHSRVSKYKETWSHWSVNEWLIRYTILQPRVSKHEKAWSCGLIDEWSVWYIFNPLVSDA